MGSEDPEGVASRCQKETSQQASQRTVRAESFGNRVGHALIVAQEAYSETPPVRALDVGSYDDGVELLKSDTGCTGIPAPVKPEPIEVGPETNSTGCVRRDLQVREA